MTRRAAPLLVDRLPLYATDRELAPAILGERAAEWQSRIRFFEFKGLPKVNALMGGRYVPAVLAFFDRFESDRVSLPDGNGGEKSWTQPASRRRASSGVRASAAS